MQIKLTLKQVERLANGEWSEAVVHGRFNPEDLYQALAKRVLAAKKEVEAAKKCHP